MIYMGTRVGLYLAGTCVLREREAVEAEHGGSGGVDGVWEPVVTGTEDVTGTCLLGFFGDVVVGAEEGFERGNGALDDNIGDATHSVPAQSIIS